jgi:hypothetical protein
VFGSLLGVAALVAAAWAACRRGMMLAVGAALEEFKEEQQAA